MDRRKDDLPEYEPKLLPRTDPILVEHYADIMAVFPDAEFVKTPDDVIRFRENKLFAWILDKAMDGEKGRLSLNDVARAYFKGEFSMDRLMDFYQGIGYSLSGFLDIFHEEVTRMEETGRVLRAGGRPEVRRSSSGP